MFGKIRKYILCHWEKTSVYLLMVWMVHSRKSCIFKGSCEYKNIFQAVHISSCDTQLRLEVK